MKRFRYSALTASGELVKGELLALDTGSVMARLHEQALLPIGADEWDAEAHAILAWSRRPAGPIRGQQLGLISQQLARLLKAGLPLDRALAILIDLAPGRRMMGALQRTLDRVRDGAALADALAREGRAFPESFITLVRAGELSGALQGVLSETASFLVRSEAMRQKVVSAMIYPVILIVVASLSVGLILTAVLPQFEPMFREAGARLPSSTRLIIAAGHGLRQEWWVVVGLIVAGVLAARAALRNAAVSAAWDQLVLGIPLLGGLILRFEIGRFCRTLGVMLASGVAAPMAMGLAGATIGNKVLAMAVENAATRFKQGEGLSGPLARTGRFPKLAIQLIRIGEETGRLDDMLGELAGIYDLEVQRALDRLLAVLIPALTMSMGLVIAFIVAAVMMALLSVNDLAI